MEDSFLINKHAEELRDSWQGRALAASRTEAFGAVILSVLAHNFADAIAVLLHAVFPGFKSIKAPFICSAAKIDHSGHIVADLVVPGGAFPLRDMIIFKNEQEMRDRFRKFADRIKCTDTECIELFQCLRNWVVADRRIDPTMDARDPDAKRIVTA